MERVLRSVISPPFYETTVTGLWCTVYLVVIPSETRDLQFLTIESNPRFLVAFPLLGMTKGEVPKRSPASPVQSSLNASQEPEMKVLTEYLKFHTKTHRAYVHITPQVESAVKKSGVQEGMALVSAMHITAGIYVNDNESGLIEDIDQWLEKLAPFNKNYQHHQTGEDNGDSHLKALLIHHEVVVPITAGNLDLGTWQRIFYAEFDGQRDKRVIVKVMGE